MEASRTKMRDAEQTRDLLYTMSRAQFAELDTAKAKLAANDELIQKLNDDLSRLAEGSDRYEGEIRDLRMLLDETAKEIESLKTKRTEEEIRRHGILDERDAKTEAVNDAKLRLAVLEKLIAEKN